MSLKTWFGCKTPDYVQKAMYKVFYNIHISIAKVREDN